MDTKSTTDLVWDDFMRSFPCFVQEEGYTCSRWSIINAIKRVLPKYTFPVDVKQQFVGSCSVGGDNIDDAVRAFLRLFPTLAQRLDFTKLGIDDGNLVETPVRAVVRRKSRRRSRKTSGGGGGGGGGWQSYIHVDDIVKHVPHTGDLLSISTPPDTVIVELNEMGWRKDMLIAGKYNHNICCIAHDDTFLYFDDSNWVSKRSKKCIVKVDRDKLQKSIDIAETQSAQGKARERIKVWRIANAVVVSRAGK
jgi:hypothetical protein